MPPNIYMFVSVGDIVWDAITIAQSSIPFVVIISVKRGVSEI